MMSPLLVSLLLILGLVFPLLGAALLRLFGPRLAQRQVIGFAVLLVALPVLSVIVLSRANIPSLQVAGVTLVLAQPTIGPLIPQDVLDALPIEDEPSIGEETTDATIDPTPGKVSSPESSSVPDLEQTTVVATATLPPTVIPATSLPTAAPPTATPEPPTATLEPPTVTPEPPTATPEPAPAAPARRTYTVQPGDTLRGIAEQFNVTVGALLEANNLTAAQADALRPDQELIIP